MLLFGINNAITIKSECNILPSKVNYVLECPNNVLVKLELLSEALLHTVTCTLKGWSMQLLVLNLCLWCFEMFVVCHCMVRSMMCRISIAVWFWWCRGSGRLLTSLLVSFLWRRWASIGILRLHRGPQWRALGGRGQGACCTYLKVFLNC